MTLITTRGQSSENGSRLPVTVVEPAHSSLHLESPDLVVQRFHMFLLVFSPDAGGAQCICIALKFLFGHVRMENRDLGSFGGQPGCDGRTAVAGMMVDGVAVEVVEGLAMRDKR